MSLSSNPIGKRLRDARLNCGLTQEYAAKVVGISRPVLVQIEAGKRPVDTLQLAKFAKLYQSEYSSLLGEEGIKEEDPLVALCRIDPYLVNAPDLQKQILDYVEIFREGVILEKKLERRLGLLPPAYDFLEPQSYPEAIKQGQELAIRERQRLNLGLSPIANVLELIANQGIWAATANLSEDLSGLFLHNSDIGMAILVNSKHTRGRCRFSYAHEYAHALVDRKRSATITSRQNANELVEKRANAFASEFLMPSGGVEETLGRMDRGGQSRQYFWLYDVANDEAFYGEKRTVASSKRITSQDVALIAHKFQVSYQAAVYKLSDMRYISRQELNELLVQKSDGQDFLEILNLKDPEKQVSEEDNERPNLIGQIGSLAVEAYRRGIIEPERLLSICQKLHIPGKKLLKLANHSCP